MNRELPPLLLATLCTLGCIAALALLGVLFQLRAISESSEQLTTMPGAFWLGLVRSTLAIVACGFAFFVVLRSRSAQTIKWFASAGIAVPLIMLLTRWPYSHADAVSTGSSLFLVHIPNALIFGWLVFLLFALLSNYALKRTAGRGLNVS